MSKTFKSAEPDNRELEVDILFGNPRLLIKEFDGDNRGFVFTPSDAPALALAILEAAGVEPSSPHYGLNDSPEWNVRWASHYLGRSIELTNAHTAEAEAQAKLEAEALELYKTYWSGNVTGFSNEPNRDDWLAVARKAREMRAEK